MRYRRQWEPTRQPTVVEGPRDLISACGLGHEFETTLTIVRSGDRQREGQRRAGYRFDYNYEPARCPVCGHQPLQSRPREGK
jgi:hypothetical protein